MDIFLAILIVVLLIAVAVLAGVSSGFYTAKKLLTVMLKASTRREQHLIREKKELQTKIDLLTDRFLVKSGFGQVRPYVPPTLTGDSQPRTGRVTSPSEAIQRQKIADATKLQYVGNDPFPGSAKFQFNASAENASRNHKAGE